MVLVFTERPELTMTYAAALGGIMVGKLSVRPKNLKENKSVLLSQLKTEGYLSTFFQGDSYVFICVEPETFALNRMVDYDEEYKDVENRPSPFIPAKFAYRRCSSEHEKFRELYESICQEASYVINAATESISGTLAFLHFQVEYDVRKTVMRVAPKSMSTEMILEEFNSQRDNRECSGFADACLIYERLNWLINCNVSNAIMKNSPGIALAAGRIEAVLLSVAYEKTKTRPYQVEIIALDKNKNKVKFKVDGLTKEEAHHLSNGCKNKTAALVVNETTTRYRTNESLLLNCFDAIVFLSRLDGTPIHEATETLWQLFADGYITWPSPEKSAPWGLKPALTAAVSQMAKQKEFSDRIKPSDIDGFLGWTEDSPFHRKNTGLIITDKSPECLEPTQQSLYRLIAEGITLTISSTESLWENKASAIVNGHVARAEKREIISSAQTDKRKAKATASPEEWSFEKGGKATLLEATVCSRTHYKDYELLEDVLPLFENAFKEDIWFFDAPIRNLISWGLLTNDQNEGIRVTKRGQLLLQKINETPLVSPTSTISWDNRMQLVAQNKLQGNVVFADVPQYIGDLLSSIQAIEDVLKATGGIPLSECKCPKCAAPVSWNSEREAWKCQGDSCGFLLPSMIRGHKLSVRDMAKLLATGETDLAFDFHSAKGGPPFPARIVLDKSRQPALSFKSKCLCPKCKQHYMNEFGWGVACPDKEGCGYTANTTRCGVRLTEEDEIALFSGNKTRLIKDFVSNDKKRFAAFLYLSPDLKIKFDFPKNGKAEP